MELSRQEYWSGLPFLPPGDLPDPGIKLESPTSSALAGRFFTTSATWEAPIWVVSKMIYNRHLINSTYSFISFPGGSDSEESTCNVGVSEVAQSRLTLCDSMDCSLPGFSVRGIFQARVLEWVAISFSRGSSWPRDWTQVSHIARRCLTLWVTREAQPAMQDTWVRSVGWEDPLEEGMETHSSILAWRIPMDRGAWWATVHGVTRSWTQLSD